MPNVTLIIPTYNREKVLCDTISYALNQDYDDYEIIVIDQTLKHSNATNVFLKKLPFNVRIINHYPPSLPGARNRGIKEAFGEILIMIDDDVIINNDFIAQHVKCYKNNSIAASTGRINQDTLFITKIPAFLKIDFLKWISSSNFQSKKEKEAYRIAGGNFSVKKTYAEKIGLFDENFIGTSWGEEYDFSLRLKKLKLQIIYNPKAMIFHLNEKMGGCGSRTRYDIFSIYSRSNNLAYLVEKNRLNRLYYIYLIIYIYKQTLIKKDYFSFKGLLFLIKGHIYFIKGFIDGFRKGKKMIC